MSHKFLFNASFHLFLNKIDQEFLDKERKKGCCYCQGVLHQADYPRSPFGVPSAFRASYNERFSLCCSQCRKRVTPPSVRFFGRRWFPAPLLILISALMLGINERRLEQVRRHLGITVSESTWKRWRRWWREQFMQTPFWRQMKGLFPPAPDLAGFFPRSLLDVFQGKLEEKIFQCLTLLAPITAGNLRAV
jgi:hypothetical protein